MAITAVSIEVPEAIAKYALAEGEEAALTRNAMILYPHIQNQTISYGKAAQLLGINKLDLIALFSGLGVNYLDQTKEELQSDLTALKGFRDKPV